MIHDIGHEHLDPAAAADMIEQALRSSAPDLAAQWVVTAMHVRHHWALALFARCPHTGQTEMVVFDSAPSPITRKDMLKIARKLDMPIRFVCPARQLPMSNECGLFLILFALLVQHDVERMRAWLNVAQPPVVSLAPWRALLAAVDCEGRPSVRADLSVALVPHLVNAVSLPPALVPATKRRHDPYRAAPTAMAPPPPPMVAVAAGDATPTDTVETCCVAVQTSSPEAPFHATRQVALRQRPRAGARVDAETQVGFEVRRAVAAEMRRAADPRRRLPTREQARRDAIVADFAEGLAALHEDLQRLRDAHNTVRPVAFRRAERPLRYRPPPPHVITTEGPLPVPTLPQSTAAAAVVANVDPTDLGCARDSHRVRACCAS